MKLWLKWLKSCAQEHIGMSMCSSSLYEMLISLIYTSSLLWEKGGVGRLDAGDLMMKGLLGQTAEGETMALGKIHTDLRYEPALSVQIETKIKNVPIKDHIIMELNSNLPLQMW